MQEKTHQNLAKIVIIFLGFFIPSFIFFGVLQGPIYSASSDTINLQGKIVRNDVGYEGLNISAGSPACVVSGDGNDTCDFRVRYYDAATAGNLLLTEQFSNVEIGQYVGVFNVSLGSDPAPVAGVYTSLSGLIQGESDVYVEVGFDPSGLSTYTEVFSRMPLEASGYAIRAKYADTATGATEMSWSGLKSPTENLSLQHSTYTTLFNWATGTGTNDLFSLTSDASSNGTGALMNVQTGVGSTLIPLRVRAGSTEAIYVNSSGNVGIGTTSVVAKLQVNTGAIDTIGQTIRSYSTVGTTTFTGTGLNDLTSGGTFTGSSALNYKVEIDATGTPDTFKWSDDGGTTWDATGVAITGGAQTLNHGVTVTFVATTGHTVGDYWTFSTTIQTADLAQWQNPAGTSIGGIAYNELGLAFNADDLFINKSSGNVGIGTTSPTSLLSVGSTSQFQVNTSGDIVKLKNLSYSWPSSHTTNGFLKNDGSGNLTWTTITGLGGVSGTGVLGQATFWTGTSTVSGDNAFWWDNTNKRLGIGTTSPQEKLTLASASNFATEMSTPGDPTLVCNTTGGTLADGTYYYKIVASDGVGTTVASSEGSCTITGGLGAGSVSISWSGVTGASSYRVYGRDTGYGQYWTSSTASYTDTGTTGTTGTPPTVTTAYANKLTASGNSWLLGGNVGIGTTNPGYKLEVASGSIMNRAHTHYSGYIDAFSSTSYGEWLKIATLNLNSTWRRFEGIITIVGGSTYVSTRYGEFKIYLRLSANDTGANTPQFSYETRGYSSIEEVLLVQTTSSFPYTYEVWVKSNTNQDGRYSIKAQFGGSDVHREGNITFHETGTFQASTPSGVSTFSPNLMMAIDSSGNVGIGTASPSSKLTVYGSSTATTIGGFEVGMRIANTDTTTNNWQSIVFGDTAKAGIEVKNVDHTNDYGDIAFTTRASDGWLPRMYIKSSGYVGIGTDNPLAKLHVKGFQILLKNEADADLGIVLDSGSTVAYRDVIYFKDRGTDIFGLEKTSTNAFQLYDYADTGVSRILVEAGTNSGISFRSKGTGDFSFINDITTRVSIKSDGKVGIGTTGPTGKLTVVGSGGDARSVTIDSRELKFRGDGVAHMSLFGPDTEKSYLSITNTSSNSLPGTTGTDLMVITSSGKVGIGTTSPGYMLDVNGGARFSGDAVFQGGADLITLGGYATMGLADGNGRFSIYENADGAGGYYMASEEAARLTMTAGSFQFFTAPSGTADNAVTWTERMRITNTGNVGIGTAGPGNALHVYRLGFQPSTNDLASLRVEGNWGGGIVFSEGTGRSAIWSSSGTDLRFGTGGSSSGFGSTDGRMIISSTGNVGIGTTAPEARLDVVATGDGAKILRLATERAWEFQQESTGASTALRLRDTQTNKKFFIDTGNNLAGNGQFGIRDALGTTTKFLVDGDGKVGIGTTGPGAKLTVGGLTGTAASTTFQTNAGSLGTTAGNTLKLASIGFTSANQSSLGIEALRTANGTDWTTTAINLKMDVDNTSPVNNASITLTSAGNVGIGTTDPGIYKLSVAGSTIAFSSSSVGMGVGVTDANSASMASYTSTDAANRGYGSRIRYGGSGTNANVFAVVGVGDVVSAVFQGSYVGIGVMTPGYRLDLPNTADIFGRGRANSWTTYSDITLKDKIVPLENSLEKVLQLEPVSYYWDGTDTQDSGFIAQWIEPILPYVVSTGGDGIKSIDYGKITPYLAGAIQELNTKVDTKFGEIEKILNTPTVDSKTQSVTTPGWYRISKLNGPDDYCRVKINNVSLGSLQNLILSVDTANSNSNINIISNLTTGEYNINKARINEISGIKYLEVYLGGVNNNSIKVSIEGENTNWIVTDITKVDDSLIVENEYTFNGVLFGISDNFAVSSDGVSISGTLLTSGLTSDIGSNTKRWGDIYTQGTINLGNTTDNGSIRFNPDTKRLEFSNDGTNWIPFGSSTYTDLLAVQYPGSIVLEGTNNNTGDITTNNTGIGNGSMNYYQWNSPGNVINSKEINIRYQLPSNFREWGSGGITLNYVTESTNSLENKVDLYVYEQNSTTYDAVAENNISSVPEQWQTIEIDGSQLTMCNKAEDICIIKIKMSSSLDNYVRVGDIKIKYERTL